jgi:putative inorganic carbon (HCO3(-)) transporter
LVQTSDRIGLGLVLLYWIFSAQSSTGILGLILLAMAALVGLCALVEMPIGLPLHLPLGLFWGIATLATILSPVAYAARDGWLKLTLYLAGYLLLHRLLRKPQFRDGIVGSLLLVSLMMGIHGLRQYFYGAAELATWVDPESGLAGLTRVYSYLRNPNLYGGYLIPVIPLGLAATWIWPSWGAKLLAGFTTAVNLICLLLTYSRGAWIGGAGHAHPDGRAVGAVAFCRFASPLAALGLAGPVGRRGGCSVARDPDGTLPAAAGAEPFLGAVGYQQQLSPQCLGGGAGDDPRLSHLGDRPR